MNITFQDKIKKLIASSINYVSARRELFEIEKKKLSADLVKKIIFAIMAIFFLVVFYFLMLIGVILFANFKLDLAIYNIVFIVAGFHILVVLGLVIILRKPLQPFKHTIAQIKKEKSFFSK